MNQCANCGHPWTDHADYDDTLEHFVTGGCEHWDGCECKQYKEPEDETRRG